MLLCGFVVCGCFCVCVGVMVCWLLWWFLFVDFVLFVCCVFEVVVMFFFCVIERNWLFVCSNFDVGCWVSVLFF